MQLCKLLKEGKDILFEAGISEYESDVRVLAMYVLGCNYSDLMLWMFEDISENKADYFRKCIHLRATHMPCQYITGTQDFMGYTFCVEEGVLIPRPETELLVEEALKEMSKKEECRALDVCCGSGCIGISFALSRREMGYSCDCVTMLDISDKAIKVSEVNNEKLDAGCEIVQSDLFEKIHGKYDIIMSNPPYICSSDIDELMVDVRDFEPRLALDGREDGLYFYVKIIKEARSYLSDEGKLLFEIGYNQFEDVRRLLVDAGYTNVHLIKDYAGLDRVVAAGYGG